MKDSSLSVKSNFRYLPVLKEQVQWGLFLTDCGYASIESGASYPPSGHPSAYASNWGKGRTLNEYQVNYITRGGGIFETRDSGCHLIEEGDIFVLFPGVWHRYTPDVKTGWDEHWIGFKGEVASRFIQNMSVNPKKPVLKIGRDEVLRQRYIALVDAIGRDPAGTPFSSAGEILAILGLILENLRNVAMKGHGAKIIREAQNYILKNVLNPISFEHLAQELGMGYSSFRHHFKQQTGFSPASFQNSIRIGRAQDLLLSTDCSIAEVAEQAGFDSIYYFSRFFNKKIGLSPTAYRYKFKES
jgi:AraC-like DNA-binding protein